MNMTFFIRSTFFTVPREFVSLEMIWPRYFFSKLRKTFMSDLFNDIVLRHFSYGLYKKDFTEIILWHFCVFNDSLYCWLIIDSTRWWFFLLYHMPSCSSYRLSKPLGLNLHWEWIFYEIICFVCLLDCESLY